MDSDFQQQQFHDYFQDIQDQFQQQKQQTNSGLTRYRSAPSSYFSTFLDTPPNTTTTTTINNSTSDLQQPPRPLSPETENILATFLSSIDGGNTANDSMTQQKPCADILEESDFTRAVKQEADPIQLMYQRPPSEPGWAKQNNSAPSNSAVQGPFRAPYSTSFDSTGHGGNHLVRQRSSPAGLFNDLSIDKSFGAGLVTQSSNFGGQNTGIDGLDDRIFGNSVNRSGGGGGCGSSSSNVTGAAASYLTGYPVSSWDECGGLEGISRDDEQKMFSESENQKGDAGNRPPLPLSHHLSLPKNALEKLFRFQDSTPMKIRARRGCATHPRSIAERVRRTKISERMRKLQDLVPNMDKQTNTADMLDLAVDYIKDLQKQVKELGNNRAKCTCPS